MRSEISPQTSPAPPGRHRLSRLLRPALAVLAGILWALSFPLPGWSGFAWIAPGLLLASGFDLPAGPSFRLGFLAGFAHHLVALRWLLNIPFPSGAVAGWLALSAYSALYFGLWLCLSAQFLRFRTGPATGWRPTADVVFRQRELWRQGTWLWIAALWVALEYTRVRFLGGFPWNVFGISQWRNLPLIQVASLTGVYGISFLLVWISVSLAAAMGILAFRLEQRLAWSSTLRIPLLVLLLLLGFGLRRVMNSPPPVASTALALVQPSIPQRLIWDDAANPARFQKVMTLTREALSGHPDAVIWPEGSMPDLTAEQFETVTTATRAAGVPWIFGTAYGERVDGEPEHYNAAILVGPNGRVEGRYHKQLLVIFGEFIPFEKTIPFMKWFTPIGASFTRGRGPATFRFGTNPPVHASPLICFEDVFPSQTRAHVSADTDFILELTNNGWFGEGSAQWQHCASAALRAVENGIPLVRCANNGVTCWIDSFGGLHDVHQDPDGSVYGPGVLTTRVPLRPPGSEYAPTVYHRYGDLFAWVCSAVAIVGVLTTGPRRGSV
ncbi:MAG: apolipoprotein N-acyltransferase [Verrucomicrobiota bacterium]